MIAVVVLLDQFVWRPVIAWAEKFKIEQVESSSRPRSWVLHFLRRSPALAYLRERILRPLGESAMLFFAGNKIERIHSKGPPAWRAWASRVLAAVVMILVGYGGVRAAIMLTGLHKADIGQIGIGLGATFLRVNLAPLIGSVWTVPVGVAIGLNPRLARVAQPLVQIAASVPATALFPVVLLILIRAGGGLGLGSIVLLLLGTQWYILFNVVAGAMAIPTDL